MAARAALLLLAALAAAAQQRAAAGAAAADAATFACTAGGLTLTVQAQPPAFTYAVSSALTGAAWLEGGSLALLQAGSYLTPGAGLTAGAPALGSGADALGAYAYCAVPWAANGSAPFTANFTCYAEHIAFALHFPEGYSFASPQQTALPATHFPQWQKTASTLASAATGYVEWAGEMDTYGNSHGVGLQGYQGGVESGPLLLYNASQLALGGALPQALVLGPGGGPGTHVAHGVLGVVRDPAAAPPAAPCAGGSLDCYAAPHTDKAGGSLAPGVPGGGLLVQAGNASACCAACAALGQLCDAWVYDTDGTAGDGNNCWPLLGVTGSTQGAGDRVLGLAPAAAPACPAPETDAAPAASTPSLGFEAGVGNSTPAACCRLCGTLGPSACASWVLHSASGLCFPLLTASAARAPAPGVLTGAPAPLPMVLAAGVQGRIAALPPRFASVWWLAGAASGLSDAVMAYGWALRRAAGLQRLDKALDPQRNLLTYWSDNGAFYYDGYWPQYFNASSNTAEDVFLALKAYHAQLGLVVGSYQTDPWWYGGSCGASGPPPPQCTDAAWPWSSNWSAAPGFFPSGLGALGLPLTLYSNLFAQAPLNAMTQFEWVNCTSCRGGVPPYARVAVEQSYDFHSHIFDAGAAWGMNAFEVDFSDFMFEGFADFATDVRAFDAYWEGVNRASAEHAFPTQLCMSLPAITLSTPQWSHVTNARLQGDGYVTNAARYDIFQTSLLYAAVELAPFLDNVWTTGCQPAWDNAFGNATCEQHSEGLIAIATLSGGPVGFGDRVGFTNATLLNMTCRADGVLLQPSLPAVNLEAYYAGALAPAGSRARIATAPSFISAAAGAANASAGAAPYPAHLRAQPLAGAQYTFLTVFATFVGADVAVAAGDVWRGGSALPPGPPLGLFAQQLSRASLCTEGAPAAAAGCAARSPGGPADALLTANTGAQGHDVWSIAPVLPGGWAVLGELAKFTRHSPQRLAGVDPGCSGRRAAPSLCLRATGGAGEALQLAFVDPSGAVRLASLVLDSQGGAAVACGCAPGGGGCACAAEAAG